MIDVSDGDIKVKEKAVKKFIGAISGKFTTVGMRRKLRLVGGKVDVSGGNYGYVLNEKKQTKALIDALKSGEDRELKAVFKQKGWGSGKSNDIGNTYVEVSISRQHVWYVRNGKTVVSTPVVTSNVAEGNGTPTGTFSLMYKVYRRLWRARITTAPSIRQRLRIGCRSLRGVDFTTRLGEEPLAAAYTGAAAVTVA